MLRVFFALLLVSVALCELAYYEALRSQDIRTEDTSSGIRLTFHAFGRDWDFDLHENRNLIAPGAKARVMGPDGTVISERPLRTHHFKEIDGAGQSHRFSILDDGHVKGWFHDNSTIYLLDPADHHPEALVEPGYDTLVYRRNDYSMEGDDAYNKQVKETWEALENFLPARVQAGPFQNVGSCPSSPKSMRITVVSDQSFETSSADSCTLMLSAMNSISGVYRQTANVEFNVVDCQTNPSSNGQSWNSCTDINSKLNSFGPWMTSQPGGNGPYLWHLFTRCYTSGTVGLAWVGVLCRTSQHSSGVSSYIGPGWLVPAHELGHNFDCDHTADGIMIASNINDQWFSQASQNAMCAHIASDGNCFDDVTSCTPNCAGKNCGSDGCGGVCGSCTSPSTCSSSGTCTACTPNCGSRNCGSNGCGGSCGSCGSTEMCTSSGICAPSPSPAPPPTPSPTGNVWLDMHNAARAEHGLTPMTWSSAAESVARGYAEQCNWGHNSARGPYGENIAAGTSSSYSEANAMDSWLSEVNQWNCGSNSCSGVCGHYTQIVWEASTEVGCALVQCNGGGPFGGSSWRYAVCNYAPPGNYIGQRPFDASQCFAGPSPAPSPPVNPPPAPAPPTVPACWTCNNAYYNTNDGCDCNCGCRDPDCDRAGPQTLYGCATGQVCVGDQCQSPGPTPQLVPTPQLAPTPAPQPTPQLQPTPSPQAQPSSQVQPSSPSSPQPSVPPPTPAPMNPLEADLITEINNERANAGQPPMFFSDLLRQAAMDDCNGRISNGGSSQVTDTTAHLAQFGYSSLTNRRFSIYGTSTVTGVVSTLRQYASQTDHLGAYNEIGIGMCTGSTTYWVHIFASRLSECGNGYRDSGEQCDDGNAVAGDGCDSNCQVEGGYTCPNPSPLAPISSCTDTGGPPPCVAHTSCVAQGRACGILWNGCEDESCGACSTGFACNDATGQCACQPQGTCNTAGRECGTMWNGCSNITCSQPGSTTGDCPSGESCSDAGLCVADPPPCAALTCADRNRWCGMMNDGCGAQIDCGSCLTPQHCMNGTCVGCTGCSTYASCNAASQCECLTGYTGDGYTCTPIPVPQVSWVPLYAGEWVELDDVMEQRITTAGPFALNWEGSDATVSSISPTDRLIFQADVQLDAAGGEAGLMIGRSGTGWLSVSVDSTNIYFLVWADSTLSSGYYFPLTTSIVAGDWTTVRVELSHSLQRITMVVGGQTQGPYAWSAGFAGSVGLYSNGYESGGPNSFRNTILATGSRFTMDMSECMSADQFRAKVAQVLGINPADVTNVDASQDCSPQRKRQTGNEQTQYTFDVVTKDVLSNSIGSKLDAEISANTLTARNLGFSTATSTNQVEADDAEDSDFPEDAVIALSIAGALSAVIIVIIIVAVIATAGASVGGVYGVGKYRESKAMDGWQNNPASGAPPPARRSTFGTTMKAAFRPPGAVDLLSPGHGRDQEMNAY